MGSALDRLKRRKSLREERRASRKEKRAARKALKKTGLTYRERNGTTRVGDFLRGLKDVAPELLEVAGKVTGIDALEALGEKIKGEPTLNDFQKEMALRELELDMVEAQELTKRLVSDNEHSITRLVRPVTYAFILLNLAFLMYFDGNIGTFSLDKDWIPVIKALALTMTGFYFGSRGLEKIMKTFNK